MGHVLDRPATPVKALYFRQHPPAATLSSIHLLYVFSVDILKKKIVHHFTISHFAANPNQHILI